MFFFWVSVKRAKIEPPSGLVSGWQAKIQKHAGKAAVKQDPEDDVEILESGEFDIEDSPQALASARAHKKTMVKITPPVTTVSICFEMISLLMLDNQVTIEDTSVMKIDGASRRPRREKYVVADLPLTTPAHSSRWRNQFRHSIITWAAGQLDPYGTNSLLTPQVAGSIWEKVYPDVNIAGPLNNKLERNLEALVALVRLSHMAESSLIHGHPQSGGILLDWRSTMGSSALVILQEFFTAREFTTEEIVSFVEWAYDPTNGVFNFIYREPFAAPVNCFTELYGSVC